MRSTPLLGSISGDPVRSLAERGSLREYRKGTYLFHQNDDAPDVFFLWKGRVEISSTSKTKSELGVIWGPRC